MMQWRGQGTTYDIKAWVQQFIDLLPNDRVQVTPAADAATTALINDFVGFPWIFTNNSSGATPELTNLLCFIIAMGGDDFSLTDCQTAESDQTYNLTQTGGFSAGNHQILAQYARAWTDGKRQDWLAQVMRGGANSLAMCVLQSQANVAAALGRAKAAGGLGRRIPTTKHVTTEDQLTYLPYQLV